jgi:ABC-2 type transport system ATP-binding protein
MRGFLRSLAAEGRAVLVSSHLMSELQDTADHVIVIGRGRVIADASVAELTAGASGGRVSVRTAMPGRAVEVLSAAGAEAAAAGPGTLIITGPGAEQVAMLLSRNAVPFSEVSAHRATLEEAYLELTRDAVEFRATAPGGETR